MRTRATARTPSACHSALPCTGGGRRAAAAPAQWPCGGLRTRSVHARRTCAARALDASRRYTTAGKACVQEDGLREWLSRQLTRTG